MNIRHLTVSMRKSVYLNINKDKGFILGERTYYGDDKIYSKGYSK